jgi:hypothetical protein
VNPDGRSHDQAASRMSQLRKSSSAASHLLNFGSFVVLGLSSVTPFVGAASE